MIFYYQSSSYVWKVEENNSKENMHVNIQWTLTKVYVSSIQKWHALIGKDVLQ